MRPVTPQTLTVGQLTAYLTELLRSDPILAQCQVRGELSNYHRSGAGHCYFTLRDGDAELRCAMFRREADRLRFEPHDGLAVIAAGRVDVYAQRGQYQLIVQSLVHDGLGALHEAFERLKEQLGAEGLFDLERKRPLPRFPRKVAVITSVRGEAVKDMVRVLRERWPAIRIVLRDAVVQGAEAAPSLVQALAEVNRLDEVEVILFGRGGGSLEDLWAFNEEPVARALAASRIPVISAVGHEGDITIADLVADVRAATPTHAAELAVPNLVDVKQHLEHLERRLAGLIERRLEAARIWLLGVESRRVMSQPETLLEPWSQRVDELEERLGRAVELKLERAGAKLSPLSAKLAGLDPTSVLQRGYAVFTRERDGRVVKEPVDFPAGEAGQVRVAGGAVRVTGRGEGR